jgi:dTDP-4-amino-4,6-dideoxygalactose transaminase
MTEFCAAIARERLKKLDIENKLRNKYALYIFNKCKNLQGISFLKPRNKSFSCFHKLIILYNYNYFKKNINFFFNFIKKTGVPIEKVYKPLNTHAHFNPEVLPSRGISWKWKIYSNNFRLPLKMKKLNFEVTNLYSKKILLQVSLNPLLRKRDLEYFCDKIIKYNNKYKKEIN